MMVMSFFHMDNECRGDFNGDYSNNFAKWDNR